MFNKKKKIDGSIDTVVSASLSISLPIHHVRCGKESEEEGEGDKYVTSNCFTYHYLIK